MAQDTLLGFPAHTLPYRCRKLTTLSTVSPRRMMIHAAGILFENTCASQRKSGFTPVLQISSCHGQPCHLDHKTVCPHPAAWDAVFAAAVR